MARTTGPACKQCRREQTKLFLKGERCLTENCGIERRPYPPGQHGRRGRKPTPYALQLREKQKCKRIYGVLEAQFESYYDRATRMSGKTGDNLLQLLERRLDNVVYRLGYAASRREARQFVRHGHVAVNGKRVDIPSFLVGVGDVVSRTTRGERNERIGELAERTTAQTRVPTWLAADAEKVVGTVVDLPPRDIIDVPVDEGRIVELYSK